MMRGISLFAVSTIVGVCFIAGCSTSGTPAATYYTMDELKETESFQGYDVVVEPEFSGPYRIDENVKMEVDHETRSPFKRKITYQQKGFTLEYADSVNYGFKAIILVNEKDEFGPVLLRTKEPVGGVRPVAGTEGLRSGRPDPADFKARIMEYDTDNDGMISMDEAPQRMKDGFEKFDADKNEKLDSDEIDKMIESIISSRNDEDLSKDVSPDGFVLHR